MIAMTFLTDLDSRAAVKGSRDPLGIQPIWSRLGRDVIGNLSTVSGSVPDYAVLLLGFHYIEAIAETRGSGEDVSTFLKWEQLAAYARGYSNDFQFRGSERVSRRLSESHAWPIGTYRDAQILSDQKTYGLWGLYRVPAGSSGLIDGEPARLAELAREVVRNEMLPRIDQLAPRGVRHIAACLSAPRFTLSLRRQADAQVLRAVAHTVAHPGPGAHALFREGLLYGGKSARVTHGRQRVLAELLTETLVDPNWQLTPLSLEQLALRADKRGDVGQSLAACLIRIRTAESVLAPAAVLFRYLMGCDGQSVHHVAKQLDQHWGRAFQATIPPADVAAWSVEIKSWDGQSDMSTRWLSLAESLHDGRYGDAIDLLLKQNEDVMQSRAAAAPWIQTTNGILDIRFKDEAWGRLPAQAELPHLWRHAYFIQSLRAVAAFLDAHS